jgi:hypothetical protein
MAAITGSTERTNMLRCTNLLADDGLDEAAHHQAPGLIRFACIPGIDRFDVLKVTYSMGVPAANSLCPSPHAIASSRLEAVFNDASRARSALQRCRAVVGGAYVALHHGRGSGRWIKPADVEAVFNVAGRARRALQQRRAVLGGACAALRHG